jgi:hypothetical protein
MSLPSPHEPRHDGGRWETIRYAIDSNARTLRLCLIWAVAIVSPVAATVITLLVRHMLLGGPPCQAYKKRALGSFRQELGRHDRGDEIGAFNRSPAEPIERPAGLPAARWRTPLSAWRAPDSLKTVYEGAPRGAHQRPHGAAATVADA